MVLLLGVSLHVYQQNLKQLNQVQIDQYQKSLEQYQENNIYYNPQATRDWLAIRQNTNGYFVTNPDLINEPSQLNANSLRATRYAITTLAQLGGLDAINVNATKDFILSRYQEVVDDEGNILAGFRVQAGEPLGIRPTMDALLTLNALSAMDSEQINLSAINDFIMSHQNTDGGFWDPHYPKYGQQSCLKCTSFAMRALGILNQFADREISAETKSSVVNYVKASWDPNVQSYSEQIGSTANDSYDIFRAFISLWHLNEGTEKDKRTFVTSNLNITDIKKTIDVKFKTPGNTYSRKISPSSASMKATHLLVWLFYKLDMLDFLDQKAVINYVRSKQSNPGEYGGDIYNTYSATGIFTKLGVATTPLIEPVMPTLNKSIVPSSVPYLLYILAIFLVLFSTINTKKHLENKTTLLESQVNKDKLTGLFNRAYLESSFVYHAASDKSISLILLDIDNFKAVNDNFGHLAGDFVLQSISKLISDNTRKTDVLARWGGEEFAILCPSTQSSHAKFLAEKVRGLIQDNTFDTIGNLTCSFGITSMVEGDTMNSLFKRADKALYQAKDNGKNQVVFSS